MVGVAGGEVIDIAVAVAVVAVVAVIASISCPFSQAIKSTTGGVDVIK